MIKDLIEDQEVMSFLCLVMMKESILHLVHMMINNISIKFINSVQIDTVQIDTVEIDSEQIDMEIEKEILDKSKSFKCYKNKVFLFHNCNLDKILLVMG